MDLLKHLTDLFGMIFGPRAFMETKIQPGGWKFFIELVTILSLMVAGIGFFQDDAGTYNTAVAGSLTLVAVPAGGIVWMFCRKHGVSLFPCISVFVVGMISLFMVLSAALILRDWFEIDLQNAQLALYAMTLAYVVCYQVPALIAPLARLSYWRSLLVAFVSLTGAGLAWFQVITLFWPVILGGGAVYG